MFNVGMYGGSFDPLHLGHIQDIIRASSMCKELHVILSFSEERDHVFYKQRWQWLVEATKDFENVILHAIEDNDSSKEVYNWEKGARDIKAAIGKPIDAVFCGDDYKSTDRFERLYFESKVIYFDRSIVNISSTEIRENPIKYWDYLPKCVRPYYAKKVLVVGGESTGKSTLVRNLALAFNTSYLEEVGRIVCERSKCEEMMLDSDFYEIMMTHKAKEFEKLKEANKVLFVDTDCLTTLFYSELLSNDMRDDYRGIAQNMAAKNHYDLVIFLEPKGTEFIQDGTRNEDIGMKREEYSSLLEGYYKDNEIPLTKIGGDYLNRFEKSLTLVNNLLGV